MRAPFGTTVTILRDGEVDRWGDPVEGPAGRPRRVRVRRCVFSPGTSTEPGAWSNSVVSDASLLLPYRTDLRATDRVEVEGIAGVWTVEGEPSRWRSPFTGRRFGLSATLRRAEN